MLISETMFLLVTNPRTGGPGRGPLRRQLVSAALVCDLAAAGAVELQPGKIARLLPAGRDGEQGHLTLGHPALDNGARVVAEKVRRGRGARLTVLLSNASFVPYGLVAEELVRAGQLRRETRRGIFRSREVFPAGPATTEPGLRERLRRVMEGSAQPTPEEAAVLTILHGANAIRSVLKEETRGMARRQLTQRIDSLPHDESAGATSQALRQILAAAAAAAAASAAAATAAST